MLTMMLELEGFHVIWASSAEEAMLHLRRRAPEEERTPTVPDLVLLDLQLPDMDGADMVRLLHSRSEELPPVIVVSAWGTGAVAQAASSIRAADVLVKPFEVQALLDSVAKILRSSA